MKMLIPDSNYCEAQYKAADADIKQTSILIWTRKHTLFCIV